MNNPNFINQRPVSAGFFAFLEREYPSEYEKAVKSDYASIDPLAWSDYWARTFNGELDDINNKGELYL